MMDLRIRFCTYVRIYKANIEQNRAKALPPIPKVIQDVNIEDDWSKTFRSENFLVYQDTASGVVIFCTDTALNYLLKSKVSVCVGNFKTCPEPFVQIYCIHACIQDFKIPLVGQCSLANRKTTMPISFLF